MCEANRTLTGSSGPVDVGDACAVLRPGTCTTTSTRRGAVLFRRFALARARRSRASRPPIWRDAVRRQRPGQHAARPQHRPTRRCAGAADAVTDLQGAGIPLDVPLRRRAVRAARRREDPDPRRPGDASACSTRSTSTWTPGEGYPDVPHGSSFVQVVRFDGGALPAYAHDPHLLAVDQPDARPTSPTRRGCSAQGVGTRRLLRGRHPRRPAVHADRVRRAAFLCAARRAHAGGAARPRAARAPRGRSTSTAGGGGCSAAAACIGSRCVR